MGGISSSHGSSMEPNLPKVTDQMVQDAIRVILGNAKDLDDARLMLELIGITREQLESGRRNSE